MVQRTGKSVEANLHCNNYAKSQWTRRFCYKVKGSGRIHYDLRIIFIRKWTVDMRYLYPSQCRPIECGWYENLLCDILHSALTLNIFYSEIIPINKSIEECLHNLNSSKNLSCPVFVGPATGVTAGVARYCLRVRARAWTSWWRGNNIMRENHVTAMSVVHYGASVILSQWSSENVLL